MRLILLDGLPGTGKSVTAQHLALRYRGAGQTVRWFHERDPAHPVFSFRHLAELRDQGGRQLAERLIAGWQRLDREEQEEIVILDGTLLNLGLGMLLAMRTPFDRICETLDAIAAAIRAHDSSLVYLSPASIPQHLSALGANRGSQWGYAMHRMLEHSPFATEWQHRAGGGALVAAPEGDGVSPLVLAFWEHQHAVIGQLMARWPLAAATCVRQEEDWSGLQEQVAALVAAPDWTPIRPSVPALLACLGAYRGVRSGRRVTVTTDGTALYLQHPDGVVSRLISNGEDTSAVVEGLPAAVHFRPGSDRTTLQMTSAVDNDRVITDDFEREGGA
jgi:hypothetical protein